MAAQTNDHQQGGDGRLLRDTYSSKTKAEASRSTRSITKKPSTELVSISCDHTNETCLFKRQAGKTTYDEVRDSVALVRILRSIFTVA